MTHARLTNAEANDALCAQTDPETFFPDKGESSHAAIAVCHKCPVRRACLAHALTHPEMGVWGGTTEVQRRQILAQREKAA